jgi:hypothetical protein
MIQVQTKVKAPKVTLTVPTNDPKFWKAVGLDAAKGIVKRTQAGRDVNNRGFKSYKESTKKQRTKRGRTPFVNLTDTGRMLGSVFRGVRAKGNSVILLLTGEQANKAWNIERGGREFFGISRQQIPNLLKRAQTWIRRKNKMK